MFRNVNVILEWSLTGKKLQRDIFKKPIDKWKCNTKNFSNNPKEGRKGEQRNKKQREETDNKIIKWQTNPTIPITTLNRNGLNITIKRYCQVE